MCTFWSEMPWEEPSRQQITLFAGLCAACASQQPATEWPEYVYIWTLWTISHTNRRTAHKTLRSYCIPGLVLVFENISTSLHFPRINVYLLCVCEIDFFPTFSLVGKWTSILGRESWTVAILDMHIMSEWISAGNGRDSVAPWIDVYLPTHGTQRRVSTTFAHFFVHIIIICTTDKQTLGDE